jgi:hypothetical protein
VFARPYPYNYTLSLCLCVVRGARADACGAKLPPRPNYIFSRVCVYHVNHAIIYLRGVRAKRKRPFRARGVRFPQIY